MSIKYSVKISTLLMQLTVKRFFRFFAPDHCNISIVRKYVSFYYTGLCHFLGLHLHFLQKNDKDIGFFPTLSGSIEHRPENTIPIYFLCLTLWQYQILKIYLEPCSHSCGRLYTMKILISNKNKIGLKLSLNINNKNIRPRCILDWSSL